MTVLEWPNLIPSGGFKRGELVYHIADFTPVSKSKSWAEEMYSASIAARAGSKTQTTMLFWEDECSSVLNFFNKLFPRKRTKLLQSKSKCPRIVRVVIK